MAALPCQAQGGSPIILTMDRNAIVEELTTALEAHGKTLACAYLFGSQARDEAGPDSDVDVAVLYGQEPEPTLSGMGQELELAEQLGRAIGRPVDLVVMNRASPDLVHRILRDGILLVEPDRSARVRFEVKSRAEYLDILPYLRAYRRARNSSDDRP